MPKCIRCGKETMGDRVNWDDWKLVKAYTDVEIGEAEYRFFQLGLCPDCRIYSKPEDNVWLDPEHPGVRMLHQHEHDIETLGGCLKAMEQRTAKLEREMDRVWEVIRCMGEK